jgi:hypothetical protein
MKKLLFLSLMMSVIVTNDIQAQWLANATAAPANTSFTTKVKMGIGYTTVGTYNSMLCIKGSGATSATSSLNIINSGSTYLFFVRDDGNIGLGTTIPAYNLSFNGDAAKTIGMERTYAAKTPTPAGGNILTILSGGATVGGTDKNGGDLYLKSGISTGSGYSNISFYTPTPGTSGTTDRTPSEKMRITGLGFVGIGTTSPAYSLDINGSERTTGSLFVNANIGIGTTNPAQKLQIDAGNILVRGANNFASTGNDAILYLGDVNHYIKSVNGTGVKIGTYGAADAIFLQQGTGNVGIGTSNFSKGSTTSYYKLAVNGNIHVKEVVVETGWSDFVFEKDYKLKSLKEVENYIMENKHLPDVPSANEVAKDGVSLGQSDSVLLQKIEELTLYIIELNKRIEVLETNSSK